ncbi:MAG TPA: chemotaxis-specific protein-glutamate methyltransferase CheB [Polyangiaceae bacterium]|nr:chemotaxis-specific protein-glutamate methyltransferase CheB [Polyangiaceae bacterium]
MSKPNRIRVLVVDDSAFARKVLRQALEAQPEIDVVGIAADGLEALEKISALEPDVITLDLVMPHLDGIGVLRELGKVATAPRVVVVSFSGEESELVVQALQGGAVDFLKKPTALATDRLYELSEELVGKVKAAARARSPSQAPPRMPAPAVPRVATQCQLVVLGTSTGGPQALTRLLAMLPANFPVPIAIALHIPEEYTASLAKRLDAACPLHVVEASEGLELQPGLVALARGGINLEIERRGTRTLARLTPPSVATLYVPSVNLLFESAARAWGAAVVGAVLTGMGDDGLLGSRALVAAGAQVLTEAESTSVIYGMPRCVREAGLSVEEAPLDDLAAAIVRRLA